MRSKMMTMVCLAGVSLGVVGSTVNVTAAPAQVTTLNVKPVIANTDLVFNYNNSKVLTLKNSNAKTTYTIKDSFNKTVLSGSVVNNSINLNKLSYGWYSISLNNGSNVTSTSFMIVDTNIKNNPTTGVATHLSISRKDGGNYSEGWKMDTLKLADKIGIGNVRDDTFLGAQWNNNTKTFKTLDTIKTLISTSKSYGMDNLFIMDFGSLAYSPNGLTPPLDQTGYVNYAKQINLYLKQNPNVKNIEIWNEWNGGMGGVQCKTATCYATMLKTVYPLVKKENPTVNIVTGVTARYPMSWWEEFIKNGAVNYSDMFSYHPYGGSPTDFNNQVKDIEAQSKKWSGKTRPVVISEIGWTTTMNTGKDTSVSDRDQSARLISTFASMQSNPGVKKVYWYDLINDGFDRNNGEHNYGLYSQPTNEVKGYAPKMAAYGFWYYNYVSQISKPTFNKVSTSNSNVTGVKINNNVTVYFNPALHAGKSTQNYTVTVNTDPKRLTTLTDAMGKSTQSWSKKSSVKITVGNEPVFVRTQ